MFFPLSPILFLLFPPRHSASTSLPVLHPNPHAQQLPFRAPPTPLSDNTHPPPNSLTLIDLLARSSAHSSLLRLLQRTRLVPTINLLKCSTLLAPTNDAVDDYLSKYPQSLLGSQESLSEISPHDNLNSQLRQTLLYHLLNFSLPSNVSSQFPQTWETLLMPRTIAHRLESKKVPLLSHSTPEDQPLLGSHGQRLRFFQRDGVVYAGVNQTGQGGIPLPPSSEFQEARNGLMIPVERVLTPPPSMSNHLRSNPRLKSFSSILPDDFDDQIAAIPSLTLFAPDEDAWAALGPLERNYLASDFSRRDAIELLFNRFGSQSVSGKHQIGYSDRLNRFFLSHPDQPRLTVTTLHGQNLTVDLDPESRHLRINGSEPSESDILASNGVLHVVPKLLLPLEDNPLEMTAEKYLVALNCSKFVTLFRSANLSLTYLTNLTDEAHYTILAPRDDTLRLREEVLNGPADSDLPLQSSSPLANDTTALERLLTYHVIRGKFLPENLTHGMLLSTELGLRGDPSLKQRISVSVSGSGKGGGGSEDPQKGSPSSILGFGGVNVLGVKPLEVGNVIIYVISQIIEPPLGPLQVALSDIRLSTCVASIYSAKFEETLKSLRSMTFLIPTNKAYMKLGLIMDYLLLERSKADLIKVLKYHVLTELTYLEDLPIGHNRRYPTLAGSEVYITKAGVHLENVTIHGPSLRGYPLNGEERDPEVINTADVLTDNGSLEVIDQVELPPDLEVDLEKLMLGAKASTMLELIKSSRLAWVLRPGNDSSAGLLQGSAKEKSQSQLRGFTILCPSDEAFNRINLTYYLEDRTRLDTLISQHLIPSDPRSLEGEVGEDQKKGSLVKPFRPLLIEDGKVYSTLMSKSQGGPSEYGDVSFRQIDRSPSSFSDRDDNDGSERNEGRPKWMVGIKGARSAGPAMYGGQHASPITNFGKATPRFLHPAAGANSAQGKQQGGMLVRIDGGVLSLDQVLVPYEPDFWDRFGKLVVILGGFLAVLVCFGGYVGWKLYMNKQGRPQVVVGGYQVVEPMEE